MAERYTRLFHTDEVFYQTGMPVLISATALLKDNKNEKVLAQVKLKSVSNYKKPIIAIIIAVQPLDVSGTPLGEEIEHQFLDLSVKRDEEFGQKTPIYLPDSTARGIRIRIKKTVFEDGGEVSGDNGPELLRVPRQESISSLIKNPDCINQYIFENGSNCKYAPMVVKGIWCCCCGGINWGNEEKCHSCGANRDSVLKINIESLKSRFNERMEEKKEKDYQLALILLKSNTYEDLKKADNKFFSLLGYKDSDARREECKKKLEEIEQREKEARRIENEKRILREEREAQIKKKKKRKVQIAAAIIATIAVACIAFFIFLTKVIIPNGKYNAAVDLYNEGKYTEAIEAFNAMNGYKDSAEQISKCETAIKDEKYNTAIELYNTGNYSKALSTFKSLNRYKDSADQAKKCEVAILDEKYNAALASIDQQDYINAYENLVALKDYKDSSQKAKEIFYKYEANKIKIASVGDEVCFGSYEQDDDKANGKEKIKWLVLDRKGNKFLVISKHALDCKPYNKSYKRITWKSCTLRKWLNGTFLNNAFSKEEKSLISKVTVSADKNPKHNVNAGKNTTDQVFLLSIEEAEKYFSSDSARICDCTSYCFSQESYQNHGDSCWWWLRSPGEDTWYAAGVSTDGSIYYEGLYVDDPGGNGAIYGINADVNVRPALWISIGA